MGFTDIVLYTCAGGMRVIYLSNFTKMIPVEVVQGGVVNIPQYTIGMISGAALSDPIPQTMHFKEVRLSPIAEISDRELATARQLFDIKEQKIRSHIEHEIKHLVAQHENAFFMKDLSMDGLNKLSEEYAKNMGSDCVGVHIKLSDYQKLFLITSPEHFKMFLSSYESRDIMSLHTKLFGKLACLREDMVVVGRYENLTFMNELNAQRIVRS